VVATTCGELAGFTIPATVGATATGAGVGERASLVLLVLAGVGEGAVLGWAQSRMLRRELPELRTGDWIRATAAGAGVAWTIGMLPSTLGGQVLELWPPLLAALGVLAGVALLASIGFAQWLVLRRHVDRSGVWVVANALAWIAGLVVVFAIGVAPGGLSSIDRRIWCTWRLGHGAGGRAGDRPVPGPVARPSEAGIAHA
jgi:hypothetical protein